MSSASQSSSHYRPQLREARIRFHTTFGWIDGTVHIPMQHALLHFVNRQVDRSKYIDEGGQYLKVTAAHFAAQDSLVPFLALRRDSVSLIVPSDPEEKVASAEPGHHVAHVATFLLPSVFVRGTIKLPANIRLSDYLQTNRGFLCIREATVVLNQQGNREQETSPALLLNSSQLIGVATE